MSVLEHEITDELTDERPLRAVWVALELGLLRSVDLVCNDLVRAAEVRRLQRQREARL
jgi:hypothetical protein